jgi:nucleoside-diphosphate-sugar epimerase
MRVLVAGATGVVGRQLVPLLVSAGHEVVGTTRSERRMSAVAELGGTPLRLDVLDRAAVHRAVADARPDAIVHQATDLAALGNDFRHFDKLFAGTNRLRTEGTGNLFAAGREAGVQRYVVQSYRWGFTDADGVFDPNPPSAFRESAAALMRLEQLVRETPGAVALRYGGFYGPGTSLDRTGPQITAIRKRRIPVVGSGEGYWTFLHVYDAATAALAALARGEGVYTVIDDEPAQTKVWLPYLADLLGAKPPRRVPAWVGRLAAGPGGAWLMTSAPSASNETAKRELDWAPRYRSWRDGFRAELAAG